MMRKLQLLGCVLCLLVGLVLVIPQVSGAPDEGPVVAIEITGTIDPGTESFVRYALEEAETIGAVAVILELDTPGGFIDSALAIRRLIDDYGPPVYAFVRPNAISAGAYLALAADAIYMAPGSTIGAAEPRVMGVGEVDEKTISYWEKEMVGMAERRNRDPQIASAMVRSEVAIEGLVEQNVLLTLTANEALTVGYSEGTVTDRYALLEALGLPGAILHLAEPRLSDRIISWVTNPVVGTILLMIGISGLLLEVTTSGFGLAGITSMAAFAIYFGGNMAAGLAEYWVLFLFFFGIALMLVEVFIPGFGVFGVAGFITTIGSVVLAAASVQTGLIMVLISTVLAGIFIVFAVRIFTRRSIFRNLILSEEERSDLGYVAPLDQKMLTGRDGVAITALRPSGTAEIDGRRVDVVTSGDFIAAGESLIVDKVEGVRVVVRRLGVPERKEQ
ncbi:MAG TPA: NfeD family protein [Candidatus Limnocylindrales bacterium]|nr:NfeD family protein [Candidatus Limnocylindrales bacterium]